ARRQEQTLVRRARRLRKITWISRGVYPLAKPPFHRRLVEGGGGRPREISFGNRIQQGRSPGRQSRSATPKRWHKAASLRRTETGDCHRIRKTRCSRRCPCRSSSRGAHTTKPSWWPARAADSGGCRRQSVRPPD